MFVKNVLPPTGTRKKRGKKERKGKTRALVLFDSARSPFPSLSLLFFFFHKTNNKTNTAALMADVYDEHKDVDGFLYMTFSGENTFGGGAVALEEEGEEGEEGDEPSAVE